MSSEFINGAKYKFSTTLAAAVAITAMSNASPAVMTASPVAPEGDVVILEMDNWTDLNDTGYIMGISGAIAELVTTDTSKYTPAAGTGTYQIAGGFTSLDQIRDITQSGGDTNSFNYQYIDDASKRQRSKPTSKNPLIITFTMDYDPTRPWHNALVTLDEEQQLVTMQEKLPTGDTLVYTGFVSFQDSPTRTANENMEVVATMSVNSRIIRYPAGFTGS